jgi:segregation and condensation protein B
MSEPARDLRMVEAMLFASAEPVSETQLAARLPEGADVGALLAELRQLYDGRGVQLVKVGKSWAFRTAPDLAEALRLETESTRRLSRAAIETLSIIAYHQPVTRAEIEEIRGVSHSKGTLDVLLEAGWIKPGRRRMSPGRPVTWLTTPEFLDHFGLETVKDLPGVDELKSAGLLDTRPAIQAFRGIVDTEAETDEDAEADAEEADGDEEVIDLSSEPSIADAADAAEEEPEGEEPGDQAPEELADQQDDAGEIVRQAR